MKQETENRQQRPQMICLCATCANAFYNVPTIRIQRVDRYQLVKDMNKKDVCATKIAYVRFTEDDLADLDNQVRRVGASSRGAYIRSLIKGVRPVELPPADYVALIDELAKLRRSIDTMAARAADNKASALSPVEYYTLSSLTALTLQKIRLAALPQQYHLPEDMSHE